MIKIIKNVKKQKIKKNDKVNDNIEKNKEE